MWYVAVIASDPRGDVENVYTYFIEGESRENAAAKLEEVLDLSDGENGEYLVSLRPVPEGVVGTDEAAEPVRPEWLYPQ